ncbi:MAG: type II toxin-antitoxin system Phd/YefM family antitoxin [Verrucomicrobiota bacterium]
MHTVTIHEAKTHLSRLIQESLAGEEVIIAKGKMPLVKIQPLEKATKQRRFGGAKGIVKYISDDFDAPLDEFADYM